MKTRTIAPPVHRAHVSSPAPRAMQPAPAPAASGAGHDFARVRVSAPDRGAGPIQPMLRRLVTTFSNPRARHLASGGGSGGGGKKPFGSSFSSHRDDTTISKRQREIEAAKRRREMSDHEVARLLHQRQAPRREKLSAELKSGAITQERHDAGLHGLRTERWNTMTSFHGPIYGEEGKQGEELRVTGTPGNKPSGLFTTRDSAGPTPEARRENLALPDTNTAQEERTAVLEHDQTLLSGEVAPQGPVGTSGYNTTLATHLQPLPNGGYGMAPGGSPWVTSYLRGGGQQVVTDGGRFSGAVSIGDLVSGGGHGGGGPPNATGREGQRAQVVARLRKKLDDKKKKDGDT